MKRILSLILLLVLLVSLAACAAGGSGQNTGSGTVSSGTDVLSSSASVLETTDFDTDTSVPDTASSGTASDSGTDAVTDSGTPSDSSEVTDSSDPEDAEDDPPEDNPDTPDAPDTPDTPSSSGASSGSSSTVNRKAYDPSLEHMFLATDIRNHSIVVFDLNACDGNFEQLTEDSVAVVWEWDADEDPNCKIKPGTGIDAAKYRYSPYYKRDVIIACSSSGWAGVIDYKKKTVLWEYRIGDGPHSIELMPESGDIVVGCSSGASTGKLAYVPLSAGMTSPSHVIDVPSCHGVSWDPQNEFLWVLEYSQVFACKVSGEGTKNARLTRINGSGASFEGQDASGHAFTPVYGEPGKYWVSAGKLWQFDSVTVTLTRDYNQYGVYNAYAIKGVAGFADGTVIETVAKSGGNTTYDWSCGGFRIITMQRLNGSSIPTPVVTEVIFEDREFYKVHPFTKEYQ